MPENKLTLTVGLPRSGKSTWSRDQGVPVVNADSIRLALYEHAFIKSAEGMVWAIAEIMVKALFISGHSHVILDTTNCTKYRREKWKSSLWTRHYQVFSTPKEVCLQRAKAQGQDYLEAVIEDMTSKWEAIEGSDLDEGSTVQMNHSWE